MAETIKYPSRLVIFVHKEFKKLIEKTEKDRDALAVVLFGSYVRKESFSDVDVCIVLKPKRFTHLYLSSKRLRYSIAFPNLDIQIFQQLPLPIKMRILKEGKVIFCKDEDALYDLAFSTIREFELFKPRYLSYLEGVLHAG
ncbi:MAG: nucleotidyltransferase domain-containing protein [Candidatus Bathyarchaeia archaeon]